MLNWRGKSDTLKGLGKGRLRSDRTALHLLKIEYRFSELPVFIGGASHPLPSSVGVRPLQGRTGNSLFYLSYPAAHQPTKFNFIGGAA